MSEAKLMKRIYALEMAVRRTSVTVVKAQEALKTAKDENEKAEEFLHEAIMEYKNPKLEL